MSTPRTCPSEESPTGATEAGSKRTRIHGGWDRRLHYPLLATEAREKGPPLALLSPDLGSCISRVATGNRCARPLLRCPDFPQLSLALTIGHTGHPGAKSKQLRALVVSDDRRQLRQRLRLSGVEGAQVLNRGLLDSPCIQPRPPTRAPPVDLD